MHAQSVLPATGEAISLVSVRLALQDLFKPRLCGVFTSRVQAGKVFCLLLSFKGLSRGRGWNR